jgi:hypothetical protein
MGRLKKNYQHISKVLVQAERPLTKKTNGSNNFGSINAELLQDRVHDVIQRSSEGAAAQQRCDAFRDLRLILEILSSQSSIGFLNLGLRGIALGNHRALGGTSGHHAGTDEREDGDQGETHVGRICKSEDIWTGVSRSFQRG